MIPSNSFRLVVLPRLKPFVALFLSAIALALLAWALESYQPAPVPTLYGPRAIYSLVVLSVVLALLGRILLLRLLKLETAERGSLHQPLIGAWRPLFFFDITAPLYLAAGVLIGVPAAVLTALITQTLLQGYTLFRSFVSWVEACYRIATAALVALVAGFVYVWVAGSSHSYFTSNPAVYHFLESKEFLGSVLAAIIMMLLLMLVSLPIIAQTRTGTSQAPAEYASLRRTATEYFRSPVLRFQALVLSVGPLLPVVDIFDNIAGELAWLFFLVPLFAIYYLALISTRLSIRTDEVQRTLQDLRSARRRQDELRGYASLITRVQEEERRRLARELHDDTAQALIALSLGLDGLGRAMKRVNLPEKDVHWLANLQNLADATLEGVRRACRDLRPSVLDDLGLRAAIEWLADSSAERGVPCTFTCTGVPQFTTPEAEIAIFRIVQEALSNIWRHAHATHAGIDLRYLPKLLQIIVHDNGEGFALDQQDPDTPHSSQSGLGLLGMRERATLIGATLTINSSPGEGCTVLLSLPLSEK